MSLQFNLNRPPLGDDKINKAKDFDALEKKFKAKSLKKAQGDESWWKNKKIRYSTIIAGATVVCTITYQSIIKNNKTQNQSTKHETIITPKKNNNTTAAFIIGAVTSMFCGARRMLTPVLPCASAVCAM